MSTPLNRYELEAALGPQGRHAVHVPAFLYTRWHGEGVVSFAGATKLPQPNPLRFGSNRDVVFLNGAIIVAPATAIATDALQGHRIGDLLTMMPDPDAMLAKGEQIIQLPGAAVIG